MIIFLLLVVIVLLYEISYNVKALNNNIIEIIKFLNSKAQKGEKV
jgi:hypothetical protein